MIEVLTALPGQSWEGELVARLERGAGGVRVVRRCVDLPDLLAVAAAGIGDAVIVSAGLRRLDREALGQLAASGVAVVGLWPADDPEAERTLLALGVRHVLPAEAPSEQVAALVQSAVLAQQEDPRGPAEPRRDGQLGDYHLGGPHDPDDTAPAGGRGDGPAQEPGRVVAVWGPVGAPGRSTVAVTLASEAARLGAESLLVDADPYGGVVSQLLGLLDEAPGLAAAARLAGSGGLDLPSLARVAPEVETRLRVLTGIPRAQRWPELRPSALEEVFALSRSLAALTVVDTGFCLETDEEISFDVAAPRRNGATLTAIEQADTVVAVCAADAVGVQRFVRALGELREVVPGTDLRVVVNRVRRGPVGARPERQLADALERYAGVTDAVFVADDRDGVDAALLQGRTLAEAAAGSPVRPPLRALAAELAGVAAPTGRRGRAGRPRRRAGAA
ncbi:MinD-like ATPase involved in chromosome partitioning or flagellar assembly [Motilibacter peucedani]|uniref:MinD-like ATPase involved in chromosome partitioning or flagellar assembly n=1 Tax=Motilibacter peucedani TaxID=598650 RepID=A0A420XMS3_9ACTN|nr:chromosome partitioning protein [Motilibacter peucedani]RKS72583.1 MinD-like ATPase involved in chromosome partitioning or flagellar assembly [Motilibacter peucedani]